MMENLDPRIKYFAENGIYTRAANARLAREGRSITPVDVSQIPRLAAVLPEAYAAKDAHEQAEREAQAKNPHSILNAALNGRWMPQPPGSPWAPTKEQLVNGGERKG